MASREQIAIACDKALTRIEEWAARHVGEGLTPVPRVIRRRELLRKTQLETVADWLDRAHPETSDSKPDTRLTNALALLDGNWTKSEMESVLRGADDGNSRADS